ncbi:Sensor protein ZraS [BD1-7 clade bacterium]|uniref:histidine kinase n=1 Tax=BD1-7 clade bacterium TaxID=2029982 RepID=A0A5S9MPR0_9GAMM|nr:Sensor protein ZraS [BD1-7 clade bacterium]
MFDLTSILLLSFAYLALVFIVAIAAENRWLPKPLIHHPAVYSLSLGAYAGTWAIFGALELANSDGFVFLSYYFGTSALFIFAPLILHPLLNLCRTYRLSSLADLFSFRYNSQWAGFLVSIGTLISVLPLMAIQISNVAESAVFLGQAQASSYDASAHSEIQRYLSITFCIAITLFSLIFGSRQINTHSRHEGLVVASAFQSLVKLTLFLSLGIAALFWVFDSPLELEAWLNSQPAALNQLNDSLVSNNARTLVLIFFAAALSFPHLFHLTLTENPNRKSLDYASWSFPLYLLLLSLPVLPILWANQATGSTTPVHLDALALGFIVQNPWLISAAFICTLAAASATLIVMTIAVASMCTNHLILPYYSPRQNTNIYSWLRQIKRALIVLIMLLAFTLYEWVHRQSLLNNFGYAAYTAALQFLPGILAVLYWPRGNRAGLIVGLSAGFLCWSITILLPLVTADAFGMMPMLLNVFQLGQESYWSMAAIASLGINMLMFGLVSFATPTDKEQQYVADICSQDDLSRPTRQQLALRSPEEFIHQLSQAIGFPTAQKEVHNALKELNMQITENRPFALRLLRRQIEANLSGLFGPTVARQIVTQQLPYSKDTEQYASKDIHLIEHRLESYKSNLTGLASELDELRRYHRNTIENLPIGVCTLGNDSEILLWNTTLADMTGIDGQGIIGSSIDNLAQPWQHVIREFIASGQEHEHKQAVEINQENRWITLHKTVTIGDGPLDNNQTILIEDVTETAMLEQELLHNERLASIGRLAAGVAHEIGNPITGIACLAQNLKYDSDEPAIHEAAKDILTQTDRVTRIVQSLVSFAHAGTQSQTTSDQPVSLYLCADDAIHLLSLDQKSCSELIDNLIDQNHWVQGDPQRLLQVFINLLNNALDASEQTAPIFLESAEESNCIELKATDFGPGIPTNVQEQIFEPFFTTKDPGEGTGLGLSLVYSIIEDHKGSITVESPISEEQSYGTCFTIRLPKAADPQHLAIDGSLD